MSDNSSDPGALYPIDIRWQRGKTDAVIRFVGDAEKALHSENDFTEEEITLLKATVTRMKDGTESITEFQTVEDWLETLRNHYP